jgi:hypothetical protein
MSGYVSVALPPGAPTASVSSSTATNGVVTVSWTAAPKAATSYEVWASTDTAVDGTKLFTTTPNKWNFNTSHPSADHNKVYFYRVRACYETSCSYSAWTQGVTVYFGAPPPTPGVPPSFTVPASRRIPLNYTVSWGAASGTVTRYELSMAYASNFAGESLVYSGTALSKSQLAAEEGELWYRVRACNGVSCSAYTAGKKITILPELPEGGQ